MRLTILFLLLTVLSLPGCAAKMHVNRDALRVEENEVAHIRAALQHGDWLVTRGVKHADNAVATLTNMPFSHAALYDAERDEVLEAEAQGIHTTPLDAFLEKSYRVMVVQPFWATNDAIRRGAVQEARGMVGKGYNFTGLAGINTPRRYYCTQLVIAAYKPFMVAMPDNPIPAPVKPGQMHHWGRIVYDTGPRAALPPTQPKTPAAEFQKTRR